MKKLLFIALLFVSAPAMAEGNSSAAQPANKGEKAAKQKMSFEEHKAKALQRISTHIAKAQERQACVQAASNPESLKACFPNMGKRAEGKSGKWHKEGGKKGAEGKSNGAPENQ